MRLLQKLRCIGCALALAAGLGAATPEARDSRPLVGRLPFRTYGPEQGLGNLAPWALVQDRQGFIWTGTEDGVYRFDGHRFTAFGLKDGLPSGFADHLLVDGSGRLWVGTYKGLAYRTEDGFKAVGPDQGLAQGPITALLAGPDGQPWVGTPDGLFQRTHEGPFTRVPGAPAGAVSALALMPGGGVVWVATWTEGGVQLARWDGQGWKAAQGPTALFRERIDALAVDGRGRTWARSLRGLWVLEAGQEGFKPAQPSVPQGRQKGCLFVNGQGHLWVTTEQGIYQRTGEAWTRLGPSEGLPRASVRALMEDREGSLWVAGEGLSRLLGGGALWSFTSAHGLPSDVVWSIHRDRTGQLFAGTDGGLAVARAGRWQPVRGTENFQVRTIVEEPDGSLLVAGGPEILRIEQGRVTRRFGPAEGVRTARRIFRLALDRQGDLWVATDGSGLLRGRGRGGDYRFQHQDLPGGTPRERFDDVHMDPAGQLWAAGEAGLAHWDGSAWNRYTEAHGLRNNHVSYVRGTRHGDLLMSYFDPYGLCRARWGPQGWKVVEHLDAQISPDRIVYFFSEDARGNLWVGTGRGVDVVMADGSLEHFGLGEGLVGEDTNAMAILAEPNGDVWMGTSAGLTQFQARAYRGRPAPPTTAFLSCVLGKQAYPTSSPQREVVPHQSNTFAVKFAGLSFIREGSIQHQVRLTGVDPEWRLSESLEARYPSLPHGRYRFEVRSRIGQGEWGPISAFEFEILPAWWETWWFRGILFLTAAGMVVLIIRLRVEALHHRTQVLEAMVAARTHEVEAKAHELEEANEALRNQSLTDPLTGLRNRRFLGVCMPEDVAQVNRVHRDVAFNRMDRMKLNIDLVFLMVDLDHFKSVNDQYGHAAGDEVLRQAAEMLKEATRDSDTVVRWGGEEFLVVARNAARQEASILAERIRRKMEGHAFSLGDGRTIQRTCSIGFSFFPFLPQEPGLLNWEQVVDLADHCLYSAKRAGRNGWVGLLPSADASAEQIRTGLPSGIQRLLLSGDLVGLGSMPDVPRLDWDSA